ncbi:IS1 family transposase, partial [Escherichia coli]|nr:IS1 family transposase [Escherichia coli]
NNFCTQRIEREKMNIKIRLKQLIRKTPGYFITIDMYNKEVSSVIHRQPYLQ